MEPLRPDGGGWHIRRIWRDILLTLANACSRPARALELGRRAVIFSPHFDDETLGCGGTLLQKIRAGAEIVVIFMTDGSKSHRHLISEGELSAMRYSEGKRAAQRYALPEHRVFFLGYEETRLAAFTDEAVKRCSEIVLAFAPEEVYVPYYFSGAPADHAATNRIGVAALKATGRSAWVKEYPIWFWNHWPFCRPVLRGRRELPGIVIESAWRNVQLVSRFNASVEVEDVLPLKREILAEYQSQMSRLGGDSRWSTLHDVSGGEFLTCFFQVRERFRCYLVGKR